MYVVHTNGTRVRTHVLLPLGVGRLLLQFGVVAILARSLGTPITRLLLLPLWCCKSSGRLPLLLPFGVAIAARNVYYFSRLAWQ